MCLQEELNDPRQSDEPDGGTDCDLQEERDVFGPSSAEGEHIPDARHEALVDPQDDRECSTADPGNNVRDANDDAAAEVGPKLCEALRLLCRLG